MKKVMMMMAAALLLLAHSAWAEQPAEILKERLDAVVDILKTDGEEGDAPEKQRERIDAIVREAFDFGEISKRAVARNWRRFDPGQKEAFRMVFTKMLTGRYIARLQQEYSGQEIVYVGEEMMRADRALVKTKVPRNGSDVAIDYSLLLTGGDWRVYDVRVAGVSLVKNYRGQFNKFLLNKSPDLLIEKLQQKQAQKK